MRRQKVIVHNPGAKQAVRTARPDVEVVEIPHYVDAPPEIARSRVQQLRRELGVEDGELLVSCFGYQRPTKRLRSVLEASARAAAADQSDDLRRFRIPRL